LGFETIDAYNVQWDTSPLGRLRNSDPVSAEIRAHYSQVYGCLVDSELPIIVALLRGELEATEVIPIEYLRRISRTRYE